MPDKIETYEDWLEDRYSTKHNPKPMLSGGDRWTRVYNQEHKPERPITQAEYIQSEYMRKGHYE